MDYKRTYTTEKVKKNVDEEVGKIRKKSGKSQGILCLKFWQTHCADRLKGRMIFLLHNGNFFTSFEDLILKY